MFIVLLGPPGAGKGTQAQRVAKALDIPHISSGDIFRENIKKQTDLGKEANRFITKGELVPDDLTIAMIKERLSRTDCESGALLDGFPRTPAQAEALSKILSEFDGKVNAVPYINVAEHELIERLTGRWTCRAQGHVFHEKFNPPKRAGVCDFDGSELYQRDDDKVETVTRRIKVYLEQTMPLIEYYKKLGILIDINGEQTIDQVTANLLKALEKVK
ncbi:MAG: adenylate kinase [Anaerolineales bacterium]|nr:adenylate kinase [Anaerolineales bacterium]